MERIFETLRRHMAIDDLPLLDQLVTHHAHGSRISANSAMRTVLAAVTSYAHQQRNALADELTDLGVELGTRVVPHPLFCALVAPRVVEEFSTGSGRGRVWAATWRGRIAHTRDTQALAQALPGNALEDLWAAANMDPPPPAAVSRLNENLAEWFSYTLHELPAGVLYGANGATLEEISELLAWLEKWKTILSRCGDHRHGPLVAKCERYFSLYRQYLLDRAGHRSFADFLASQPD